MLNKFLGGVLAAATWCGFMFVLGLGIKLTVVLFMLGFNAI